MVTEYYNNALRWFDLKMNHYLLANHRKHHEPFVVKKEGQWSLQQQHISGKLTHDWLN